MKTVPLTIDGLKRGAVELTDSAASLVAQALVNRIEIVLGGLVACSDAITSERPELISLTINPRSERAIVSAETNAAPKLMQHMTEPELGEHIAHQLRFIKSCETPDTIGSDADRFSR